MEVTEELRARLAASRREVTARGHDWDVADVVSVLHRIPDPVTAADPELHAILATNSTRRVNGERALGLLLMVLREDLDPGTRAHRTVTEAARLLDVPQAGDRLDRTRDEHGRGAGHPVYKGGHGT